MPNRPRPRCPSCNRAMEPLFAKRERGKTTMRVPEVFWCRTCSTVARGRKRVEYLMAP